MKNIGHYFLMTYLVVTLVGGCASLVAGLLVSTNNNDLGLTLGLAGLLGLTLSMGVCVMPDKWAFKE